VPETHKRLYNMQASMGKMPYQKPPEGQPQQKCHICGSSANIRQGQPHLVDCSRCGDFYIDRMAADDNTAIKDEKKRALASHLIRRLQSPERPVITSDFFELLSDHSLPTPAEMSDNLLLLIDQRVDGRPGAPVSIDHSNDLSLQASIGAVDGEDALWAVRNLAEQNLIDGNWLNYFTNGRVTASGWQRVEDLKRAHISSSYAFFARQFKNPDLDRAYEQCLKKAVADTGYELRTVTQRAGLIDAVIEDEIRRCRFLVADLSNNNGGAYWEAGFAQGLGKPVIYICRDGVLTHFDTSHRHTVTWNLADLDETSRRLKAVIRNTLLGDAKQADG
jgi:hypothetical protein